MVAHIIQSLQSLGFGCLSRFSLQLMPSFKITKNHQLHERILCLSGSLRVNWCQCWRVETVRWPVVSFDIYYALFVSCFLSPTFVSLSLHDLIGIGFDRPACYK